MKKRSFFERLAGNLRFDDSEEEFDGSLEVKKEDFRREEKRDEKVHDHRELPIRGHSVPEEKTVTPQQAEEIGELPVDVYSTANEIIIQTLIAGVLPENLSINITRDVVTISGKREENKGVSADSYSIRELYWGAFGRTVELPDEIEIDTAEAIERHGMLIIKLPKIDKRRKSVLKIKSI